MQTESEKKSEQSPAVDKVLDKNATCDPNDKAKGCGCESRMVCPPCLVIWGIVLLGMFVFYLVR